MTLLIFPSLHDNQLYANFYNSDRPDYMFVARSNNTKITEGDKITEKGG